MVGVKKFINMITAQELNEKHKRSGEQVVHDYLNSHLESVIIEAAKNGRNILTVTLPEQLHIHFNCFEKELKKLGYAAYANNSLNAFDYGNLTIHW